MARRSRASLSFKAFLSHRYKSPEVNRYFFNLFSSIAEVQFEVDEGTFATNVTRLERMVRGTDAFIGIYPFPGSWNEAQSTEELRKASRYFRLELDLAVRSGKPALVFYDQCYKDLLRYPDSVLTGRFDAREVGGPGGSPTAASYRELFQRFCTIVERGMAFRAARGSDLRTSVCVAVPAPPARLAYSEEDLEILRTALDRHGYPEVKILRWPPVVDREAFALFQASDWAVVDLGDEMTATGVPAFLHGQFVPMLRLKKEEPVTPDPSLLERALLGGVEVGYAKDIVRWTDAGSLKEGLEGRLLSLGAGVRRINTASEAESYFASAAMRKEAVFLSYSGNDQDLAADLAAALKARFQKVFDYRDRDSIEPGRPWVREIFDQLSSSAVGVPLLSTDYFASGNCMHELEQMVALQDSGKMRLIPIKLNPGKLDGAPSFVENIQQLRFRDYPSPEAVAQAIQGFLKP